MSDKVYEVQITTGNALGGRLVDHIALVPELKHSRIIPITEDPRHSKNLHPFFYAPDPLYPSIISVFIVEHELSD